MKTAYLVSVIATLVVLLVMPSVLALDTSGNLDVNINSVVIKGMEVSNADSATISGLAGEAIPIRVVFTSNIDEKDARVAAWVSGKNVVYSAFMHLVPGSTYSQALNVNLPSDIDPNEDYTLYVRVETKTGYKLEAFNLNVQRKSYVTAILDVDSDRTVNAGETLDINVVLKNKGYEEMKDVFVVASIPELGVERKAYFADLTPVDDTDADKEDSGQETIYLRIPVSAKAGIYELQIQVYNSKFKRNMTRTISVIGAGQSSDVLVPVTSKEIAAGSSATYSLILVNPSNKIGVYEIIPQAAEGIVVSVPESVVTIPAGTSKTVDLQVKAGSRDGTYNFAVDVNSLGNLVERVSLTANVVKASTFGNNNLTVLTIVLAIVFVVLLIVLIVLLTRKPNRTEELEESYY